MTAKVINMIDFKLTNKNKANTETQNKYINKYKEALKEITDKELKEIEDLLEN